MMYEWAKGMNGNVTMCGTEGKILFMNENSLAKYGDIIGQNLFIPQEMPHLIRK